LSARAVFVLAPLALVAAACTAGNRHINPSTLVPARGYTHVVEARRGCTIYVSGQIALDRSGALVGGADVKAQAKQVFENLKAALAAADATMDDVVKITIYMRDVTQVQAVRDVRDAYFTKEPPASTLVEVSRLVRPELLLEIDAIAVKRDAR
jgi:reactive intermediate/imine deaminase